ncbi:MAG: NAD(P)-dependent oxidoreductase [Paracoccaceae bacterium]
MTDVVITEFMDAAAVSLLAGRFRIHYDPELAEKPRLLAGFAAEARALVVRNRTQVRGPLLEGAEKLACVGRLGVGLDNIDTEACAARGIAVYPATGANDVAVAEYVVAAVLMLLRRAYGASAEVVAGDWPRERLIGREAAGKVLGLVGFGAIARETARRAAALGMEVVAHDPFVEADDPAWELAKSLTLNEVLMRSDALSLHVPLSPATRHLIGPEQVALIKPGAVLVNAARGGVLDQAALVEGLRGGVLSGAALDVFETEPLTAAAAARFEGLSNVILTPHIAGLTEESNVRVSQLVAEQVIAHLEGLECRKG